MESLQSSFPEIRALTFDCYGTLIDWETGLSCILNAWAQSAGISLRDDALLELYGRHESVIEAETPTLIYSDVVRAAMRMVAREFGVVVEPGWVERLGRSIGEWPAFHDSAEALIKLRPHYKLCVLSNVDHQSFAGSARKLIVDFDLIVTAQDVGSYKPVLRNFEALLDRVQSQLQIQPAQILHVAQSLYHDHAPAQRLGLKTVWIDRRQGKPGHGSTPAPPPGVLYHAVFGSMRDFAAWAVPPA